MVLGDPWERVVTRKLRTTDLDRREGWGGSRRLLTRHWLFQLGAIHLPVAEPVAQELSHLSSEEETHIFLTKWGFFPFFLVQQTISHFIYHAEIAF